MGTISTVLDLDTIVPDRAVIKIRTEDNPDGHLLEIRHRNELSLEQFKTIEVLSNKCREMTDKDMSEVTEAEAKMLDGWVHELLVMTFHSGFTDEIERALNYDQKLKILAAFKEVCLTSPGDEQTTTAPIQPRTKKPKAK